MKSFRTSHLSSCLVKPGKQTPSRRRDRAGHTRSGFAIRVLSFCTLAILLAIGAAATRVIPTAARGWESLPRNVAATRGNTVIPGAASGLPADIASSSYSQEHMMEGTTQCCGKKPRFSANAYASVFTGQVAVTTNYQGQGSTYVLGVIDLKNQSTLNTGPPAFNPAIYHDPTWTQKTLGTIFGLTLDDQGNIYTTATTAYNGEVFPAGATGGEIYKIDAVTGAISTFATLPNSGHVGLGNINFDCAHKNFYVTNPDDGLIYRLNTNGVTLSTWDQGANLPSATPSSAAIPDIPAQQFTPRGRLAWGVQANGTRLYYAEWARPGQNTEVWSVGLLPNGDFTGPAKREISITPFGSSMPVADISFGPAGTMFLAERTMNDETSSNAHQSRALEYTLVSGTWTLLNPNKFLFNPNYPRSAAGGVDADFSPNGRIWWMGDAIHYGNPDYIYGIEGVPTTGGDIFNSVLIALSGTSVVHKTELGDVEIPCPEEVPTGTCPVKTDEIECKTDGSGGYDYTFTVTNNTGHVVTQVLVTPKPGSGITINPQQQLLPPGGIAIGATFTGHATVSGGKGGDKVCFTVTLMTKDGECCTTEVCLVLPDCCGIAKDETIECNADGTYTYVFTIINTGPNTIEHIYLNPQAGSTMSQTYFSVSLKPGDTFKGKVIIKGAKPGRYCFGISLHTAGMKDCCSGEHCFILPECQIKYPK